MISEVLGQLQKALSEAEASHKKLEDAQAKLNPLAEEVKDKDAAVQALMAQYQSATNPEPTETTTRKRAGGRGGKRGPRSLLAITSTTATRLLNEFKRENKKKPAAITAAMERVEALAKKRNETVTDEIREAVNAKANEIWGSK